MADAQPVLRFEAGGRALALPASSVREVRRASRLTAVPLTPDSLLGLANVRGAAMPVLSAARLLGLTPGEETRLILVEHDSPMAIAVDRVQRLASVEDAELIDLDRLLPKSIAEARSAASPRGMRVRPAAVRSRVTTQAILAFAIGDQAFGLPLDQVEAVIARPRDIAVFLFSDPAVRGSIGWRDRVLPVLSLARLLGFPAHDAKRRLVVVRIGIASVGFLVDGIDGVLRVSDDLVDPVPVALSRDAAEARIQAIVRLDGGRRLLSLLAAETLLRDDLVAMLQVDAGSVARDETAAAVADTGEAVLLFDVAGDRFALPLGNVIEGAMMPARLVPVPRAPAFLRGLFNLRGAALPLIDLAARLGLVSGATGRVLIVQIGDTRLGLKVDRVRGIARLPMEKLALGGAADIVARTILPADDAPIALILDPERLLDGITRDLIDSVA